MKNLLSFFVALFFLNGAWANDPEKKIAVASTSTKTSILDGIPNERVWENAQVLEGFTQMEPNPGKLSSRKTTVRILYNDDAVFISAQMEDVSGDSVLKELTARDDIGNADWFGVFIDAYKDGINGVGFIVTASGVQSDLKYSVFGEDESWNAVWNSVVDINDNGWTAEIKIPYSALRFPNQEEQQWHINFIRYMRRTREKASWNFVDPTVNGFFKSIRLVERNKRNKTPGASTAVSLRVVLLQH